MADMDLDDIIKDNTPRLRSFVRSRLGNRDDADDIVQDTFYQFLRTISIMDNPIGQVTSWLYTVAHNLIINHGKKHREVVSKSSIRNGHGKLSKTGGDETSFMDELSEILVASDNESPEMLMLRNIVWEELDKAMSELPHEQRQAIEMTEIQGLPVKEAAQKMGVPVNTFLSRKHYGVLSIRKKLKTLYEELTNN